MSQGDYGFGLYVHWPYCARICPYCDFNVYRARGHDPEPLIQAISADIAAHASRFGRRRVDSVFLGGGTPSLLSGQEVERVLDAASRYFDLAADCEITLECNPENAHLFADQARAGINRFSIGAQALDDAALKALGRDHDAAQAMRAADLAFATDQRVSLDLIYAREGQSVAAWREELKRAFKLPVGHLSLYQLTIEQGTAFERKVSRGQITPPDDALAADLYEATQEACAAGGFPAYEISNHALSDAERSKHNLIYWRGGEWIGVGPGAHGRLWENGVRLATEAHRDPNAYIAAVSGHGLGWSAYEALSSEAVADELLLMGLRVAEGVELARVEALHGAPLDPARIADLQHEGLIESDNARLRLTPRGRLLCNAVIAALA